MNKKEQTHFTTGEFATLCGVKKQTLFHYDAVGIFSPEFVEDNGYRYYSIAQLEVFFVITLLKELDMPLKEIKAYLDRRSPDEFLVLIKSQMALLDKKIATLDSMRLLMEKKYHQTQQVMATDLSAIEVVEMETEYLFTTVSLDNSNDKTISQSIVEHIAFCQSHHVYSPYSVGSMLDLKDVAAENYANYTHFYTKIDYEHRDFAVDSKPGGRYLVGYHQGGYDDTAENYQAILDYAQSHDLRLEGPFYEEALLDDLTVQGYENYVLQIAIRIADA